MAQEAAGVQVTAWPKGQDRSSGISFLTNAWVHDENRDRVFFNGVPYLPSQTPAGLKELRAKELSELRVGYLTVMLVYGFNMSGTIKTSSSFVTDTTKLTLQIQSKETVFKMHQYERHSNLPKLYRGSPEH
jgi:hypothetical protein